MQTLTSLRDEAAATGLSELERLAERGYLAGDGEAERRAILRWQRGRLYYYQQRYAEAMTALDQAEQGLPAGGQVLRDHLAEAYEDLGDQLGWRRAAGRTVGAQASPAAEDAYQKALRLGRVSDALYNALGAVQAKLGKYQQSLENRKKALEVNPQNAYAWHGLGNVYRALRRYDEAIAAYRQALQLDPQYATPWNGLGNVYRDLRRYDEAIAAYRQALQLDPQHAYPWNGLGYVYRDLRRYDEAIAAYRQALQLDPQFAAPWYGLGLVYTLQGELEQALNAWQRALELAPTEGSYHASLANVLRRLGREEEARRAIETARPLMEHESEYNRACFAAICGDHEEALRLLQIALDQHQVLRDWARLDPDFSSLHHDPRFWALVADREA